MEEIFYLTAIKSRKENPTEKIVHIWYISPMKKYTIASTCEYDEWEASQTKKDQQQIAKRLALIQIDGHFGDHKSVSADNSIWELRWRNGRRIYYSHIVESNVLMILGGDKNGQKKDIEKSGRILSRKKAG